MEKPAQIRKRTKNLPGRFETGQPVENLTEEQLDATMGEVGNEGQEPTDAEVAALEAEEDKNPSV